MHGRFTRVSCGYDNMYADNSRHCTEESSGEAVSRVHGTQRRKTWISLKCRNGKGDPSLSWLHVSHVTANRPSRILVPNRGLFFVVLAGFHFGNTMSQLCVLASTDSVASRITSKPWLIVRWLLCVSTTSDGTIIRAFTPWQTWHRTETSHPGLFLSRSKLQSEHDGTTNILPRIGGSIQYLGTLIDQIKEMRHRKCEVQHY